MSPDFLFRIERDRHGSRPAVTSYPITPARAGDAAVVLPVVEHAGRRAAARGRHRHAARSGGPRGAGAADAARPEGRSALAENFGGQWLQFRALESLTRDATRFPDFEDYLRLSMRRETELFVEHVIREDRSILDFLDGKYTFLNERLARHYGMPNVIGPEFRRVELTGHAARRRADAGQRPDGVVVRDAHLAGAARQVDPREPAERAAARPPADVPNLDETDDRHCRDRCASSSRRTARIRPAPSCHRRMDPLGFGLENFDAVGAWRTTDGKFPIDASGLLPDGDEFNGPDELRTILERRARRVRARA